MTSFIALSILILCIITIFIINNQQKNLALTRIVVGRTFVYATEKGNPWPNKYSTVTILGYENGWVKFIKSGNSMYNMEETLTENDFIFRYVPYNE